MKNSADLGGCYPPQLSVSVDTTLLDLQNSSCPTQPHSIIANYYIPHKWIVLFAHDDWLAQRWLAKYYSPPSNRRKTKGLLTVYFQLKVTLWSASYSACVVYTKTSVSVKVVDILKWIHLIYWSVRDTWCDTPLVWLDYYEISSE